MFFFILLVNVLGYEKFILIGWECDLCGLWLVDFDLYILIGFILGFFVCRYNCSWK